MNYYLTALKAMGLFAAALYLLGFSFKGVNFYGSIDWLIPFERALCYCLSISFFVWFGWYCKIIFRKIKIKK